MRTRTVQIIIEENQDGRKRRVGEIYEAQALLVMDPATAGIGFLAILKKLVGQLDAPCGATAPTPPAPQATPPPPKPPRKKPDDENPTFREPKFLKTQRKD